MKKIFLIGALFFLALLTSKLTLAYWQEGEIILPSLFNIETQVQIGSWEKNESLKHPQGVILEPDEKTPLKKGQLIYRQGRYYLVYLQQNWQTNFEDPWNNPLKVYGAKHQSGVYYDKGAFVIKDNRLYQAHHNGVANLSPDPQDCEKEITSQDGWICLGSVEERTWRPELDYAEKDLVVWENKIYLANSHIASANPQPNKGLGWDVYNELHFHEYTIYRRERWRGQELKPLVAALNSQGKLSLFELQSASNKVQGQLIKPGEDEKVWREYAGQ